MNFFNIFLFLAAAGLTASAQLLLKRGSLLLAPALIGNDSLFIKLIKIITNPFIAVAVVLLAASMFIWVKILSRTELSLAYPINIALTIIITSTISIIFFQESITWAKSAGIVLIIVGLWSLIVG